MSRYLLPSSYVRPLMNAVTPPETFVSDPKSPLCTKCDFAHVNTWVFDLDNTLYPHESRIWPQVDERITLYLSDMFGFDALSARALQKYYYHHYGTTLKGLMEEHGINAQEFLEFAHTIDLTHLEAAVPLSDAISALSGRKLIMTNGSRQHAENISLKLGIREHFEDIFDIASANFVPKPEMAAYDTFLERHNVDPKTSAMFEDVAKNLITPHALGMKTVLVLPQTPDPFRESHEQIAVDEPYVHCVTHDLAAFLVSIAPLAIAMPKIPLPTEFAPL
jgi:putative hydrolase of the HAD superfamily